MNGLLKVNNGADAAVDVLPCQSLIKGGAEPSFISVQRRLIHGVCYGVAGLRSVAPLPGGDGDLSAYVAGSE